MEIINLHASTEEAKNAQFKKDNNYDNHQCRNCDFKRDHGDSGRQRKRNTNVFIAENAQQPPNRQEFHHPRASSTKTPSALMVSVGSSLTCLILHLNAHRMKHEAMQEDAVTSDTGTSTTDNATIAA